MSVTVKKESDDIIAKFLDALWLEKGLSDNTLQAYRSDITAFAKWSETQNLSLTQIEPQHVIATLFFLQKNHGAHVVKRDCFRA